MRRFALIATVAVLTTFVPALASAQAGPTVKSLTRAQQSASAETRFKRLDADGNGSFDKAEYLKVRNQAEQQAEAELKKLLGSEFAELDGNKDKALTAAEIDAKVNSPGAGARAVAKLDRDKSKTISLTEYVAQGSLTPVSDADAQIKRWDANGDKKVSRDEFTRFTLAQFDALDANRDGTLTSQEAAAKVKAGVQMQGR